MLTRYQWSQLNNSMFIDSYFDEIKREHIFDITFYSFAYTATFTMLICDFSKQIPLQFPINTDCNSYLAYLRLQDVCCT